MPADQTGSNDPREVPAKVNVFLADIGKQLAESAARNKRSLGEEIRQRLKQSLLNDAKLIDDKSSETNEAR